MIEPGSRPSVDFEPSDVLPPRPSRRPDPIVVATALVVVGLALAVLKPWGATSAPTSVAPTLRPAASASAPSTAVVAVDPHDRAVATAIAAAFRPHDGWGVAAVEAVDGPDRSPPFRERWWPVPSGQLESAPALALPGDGIVALGITAPGAQTPLDVRVFRLGPRDEWQWLDVARAPTVEVAGLDLLPPKVAGLPDSAWPSGRYRFDLLMGDGIERLDVDFGAAVTSGLDPWYLPPTASPTSSSGTSALPDPRSTLVTEPGVVAVADGIARSLDGAPRSTTPSAAEVWTDPAGVAYAWSEGVTSLGVVLPPDAIDPRGTIRRLVPDPVFAGPTGRVATARVGGPPATAVSFDLPAGAVFAPGVYAMEMAWQGSDGPHAGTWVVEIPPGTSWPVPPLLAAARRFRASGGRDVLIASVPPAAAQPVIAFPLPQAAGCDGPAILPQPVIGIGHHEGVSVDGVRVTRRDPLGHDIDVPVRRAEGGPGLTLVAPFAGTTFVAGTYSLTVAEPDDLGHVPMCIATGYRG